MSDLIMLPERGVVRVAGADARAWLQGLITNDVLSLKPGEGRYAALLSPQAKILFDCLVAPQGDDLLLDCLAARAGDFVKRLSLYRLRAAVTIADESATLAVAASLDGPPPAIEGAVVFADPRAPSLGWRVIAPRAALADAARDEASRTRYAARRIGAGAPEGGVDFGWGEAFPHDANLDRLHGVDFRKGCYVGQEVVSRVEHRGSARKRVARVNFEGPAPEPGAPITIDDVTIGAMGSSVAGAGLAMLRLDRIEAAPEKPMRAGATALTLTPD